MAVQLLSVKDLSKKYKSGSGVCLAVNHVSLSLEQGDFLSIIGASGSGKSSLLYLLSGMTKMTSGEVFYIGNSLSQMRDKQKSDYRGKEIGFVFQEENLLDDITVLKNVALPGYLYKKKRIVDERAAKWLDCLGLKNQKNKYPNELSGGQKQRAAIARALVNQPKIIFLDEPTGSLDAATGESVLELLVKLNEKGQSIVMVTHDMSAAARGNKVIIFKDGMINKTLDLGRYRSGELQERREKIYHALEKGAEQ